MAEQTSCLKPGNVRASVLIPPPMLLFASNNITDSPACCNVMAAASPFGPDPTTTASYSGLLMMLDILIEFDTDLTDSLMLTLKMEIQNATSGIVLAPGK